MGYTSGTALLLKTAVESFWNSYYALPDPFEGLVSRTTSTQKIDTRTWLGTAPMPEEWQADDNVKVANEYNYSTTNVPWKNSVRIGKELIKFQQWDEIGGLVGNLGEKARAHQVKKLSAMLDNGASTTSVDTQNFFDTDHTWPGAENTTNQDNDLTAAVTAAVPTDLQMAVAIRAQVDALYGFKDDRGDPLYPPSDDPANFVLMVPPGFRSIAKRVQMSDSLTGPLGNDLQNSFTVRVNPYLHATDATSGEMYMLYAGSNHKPLILQVAGEVQMGDNLQGDEFRSTGNAVFDASWWGQTEYGQWATAVMYQFTAA